MPRIAWTLDTPKGFDVEELPEGSKDTRQLVLNILNTEAPPVFNRPGADLAARTLQHEINDIGNIYPRTVTRNEVRRAIDWLIQHGYLTFVQGPVTPSYPVYGRRQ
jgi:hypothetical protein